MSRIASVAAASRRALLLLTLVLAPCQASLKLAGSVHLTPADLVLGLAALAWLAELGATSSWRRLRPPPWPHVTFACLALLSAAAAADRLAAAKDLFQIVEYFIVGHMLFADALLEGGGRRLRRALAAAMAVGAVILATALWQYAGPSADPLDVAGTFGNRNVLGGYLALLLPLCFGIAAEPSPPAWRLTAAALIIGGVVVCLSGPALLAACLAMLALAALRGPRWFLPLLAALMIVWGLALPRLPRANDVELFASGALYDPAGVPTRRYPEWQAATVMAFERPWLGVGLGNYQSQIGRFYGTIPNATGPAEPDIQNLWLVLAASAGLPAAFSFLAMLVTAAGSAVRPQAVPGWQRGCGFGIAASLAAFAIAAVWHPLLVRGIGLPLAMLLAAGRQVGTLPPHTPEER